MIDVLKKLQEIADNSPEVEKAISQTEAMNPKQQAAIAISKKEKMKEGGMSDIHIGAQEVVGEYTNDDGDLDRPKAEILKAMNMEKAKAPFPRSYEIETAMRMVQDEFDDNGARKPDMEPAMDAEQPTDEGNAFAQAVQKAKAAGLKKGDKFKVGDEEHTLRDSDFEEVNTNTMETKHKKDDKKEVKEAIQMTADTPEEAGMLMQILQMAGIKPMGAEMPNQEPEHGSEMDPGELNKQMDVPTDGDEMSKYKQMVMKPDMEKAEETFANEPNEKVSDIDTLVNVHSGGLNKQKQQVRKEYPGDNPLAVKEDTISEQDLANSLRTQYESFKQAYQEAAKPDYIDLDKDGNKTEPMKKAAKDKELKDKK